MNAVVIDTTKKEAIIILIQNKNFEVVKMPKNVQHSVELLNYLENLLASKNLNITNIKHFCAVTGPGSFTGIRVGLSSIKAFHAGLGAKLYGANLFEIVAPSVKNGTILLNCTNSSLYYGKIKKAKLESYGVIEKNEISILKGKLYVLENDEINLEQGTVIANYENILAEFFINELENKKNLKNNDLQPFYIALSQAEKNLKKEN